MLSKKLRRAVRVCQSMRDLRPDFRRTNHYLVHCLFMACCENVAQMEGVQTNTIFRQLTTKLGVDEAALSEMMLDYLETKKPARRNSRFVNLLQENLGSSDSPAELRSWTQGI